jgi:hypothetical protein
LLINVDFAHGVFIFIVATIAMLLFAAATQGYFLVKNRFYETVLLLLIAFTLFRPGFWMELLYPPYDEVAPAQRVEVAEQLPPGTESRLHIEGFDAVGNPQSFVAILPLGEGATGEERLLDAGLETLEMDGETVVDNVGFDSPAEAAGLEFDQKIQGVLKPLAQPWKELMYIPAFAVLALIIIMQRRRRETTGSTAPATA